MQHTIYLFDRYQLDVTRRKLLSAGGLVLPLNSRAMEVLLALVENAGEIIERRRLMQTVWPGTVVEDNNLNQCILAIRKALGEVAGDNRYVMTVQGRGFCFVCPVRKRIQESAESAPPEFATGEGAPPSRTGNSAFHLGIVRVPPGFWYGLATGALMAAIALLPFAMH